MVLFQIPKVIAPGPKKAPPQGLSVLPRNIFLDLACSLILIKECSSHETLDKNVLTLGLFDREIF